MAVSGFKSTIGQAPLFHTSAAQTSVYISFAICPVPNKANIRANPESRGGKIDSASDRRSDKVPLQKGIGFKRGV